LAATTVVDLPKGEHYKGASGKDQEEDIQRKESRQNAGKI